MLPYDHIDYCSECGRAHDYMSGPCEWCGCKRFSKKSQEAISFEESLCPRCHGFGTIWVLKDLEGDEEDDEVVCPVCKGDGMRVK
jgi:DnaJ-class molecular chaperone